MQGEDKDGFLTEAETKDQSVQKDWHFRAVRKLSLKKAVTASGQAGLTFYNNQWAVFHSTMF